MDIYRVLHSEKPFQDLILCPSCSIVFAALLPWLFFALSCRVQHLRFWFLGSEQWQNKIRDFSGHQMWELLGFWHFSFGFQMSVWSLFSLHWELPLFLLVARPSKVFPLSKYRMQNSGTSSGDWAVSSTASSRQPQEPRGSQCCLHRGGCQYWCGSQCYQIIVASGINCCPQNEVRRYESDVQAIKNQVVALWLLLKAMD